MASAIIVENTFRLFDGAHCWLLGLALFVVLQQLGPVLLLPLSAGLGFGAPRTELEGQGADYVVGQCTWAVLHFLRGQLLQLGLLCVGLWCFLHPAMPL